MKKAEHSRSREHEVEKAATLLPFLLETLAELSRNKVKSILTHRRVLVNGVVSSRFDHPLMPGDHVSISNDRAPEILTHPMLRVIFEDEHLLVVEKRNGLLSIGTDREREKTAFYILSEHVKRADPAARVFVVHRLDRETSGLMMFAKSEEVQSAMQRGWNTMVSDRKYLAVVEGIPDPRQGVVEAPLKENKNYKVYVDREGVAATTHYRVLAEGCGYSLMELTLETGKKNQIRAHMEHIGHPVAGDRKYGATDNPANRVCLHAYVLEIIHPVTGSPLRFSTDTPIAFTRLIEGKSVIPNAGRGPKGASRPRRQR